MNYLWQKFLVELKYHNRIIFDEFFIIYCGSASSTFPHGLPGRNMLNSFDMPNHASTTQKIVCSFELSLFSCQLTFVYQLIVKSMRAFVRRCLLPLWSAKPFYSGMTRRNKLQYLVQFWDWVKVIVFRRTNANSFCSVIPWSVTIFMSRISWELHHLLWILAAVIFLAIIIHSSVSVLL